MIASAPRNFPFHLHRETAYSMIAVSDGESCHDTGVVVPHTQSAPPLTINDLVDYLGIPKPTLYKLAQQGEIPCQKVGRNWRFDKQAIDSWLVDNGPELSPPTDQRAVTCSVRRVIWRDHMKEVSLDGAGTIQLARSPRCS
jgi:excisionase family DNA binding protein